jgi:hypothetical protein
VRILQTLWQWIVPNEGILVSAVSAIFGLYSDGWKDRRWKWLAIAGIVLGMFLAFAKSRNDNQDALKRMGDVIDRVDKNVQTRLQPLAESIAQVKQAVIDRGPSISTVRNLTLDQAGTILKAGHLADDLVKMQPAQNKSGLTIWYYPHFEKDVNFDVVKPRLEQLAQTVVQSPPHQYNSPTNSVWWGPGSSLEEAKAAALIAASAGVPIRQICAADRRIKRSVTNLIQIGGAPAAEKMPILTPEQIQNLTGPRCDRTLQPNEDTN